jgi:hypothetical protein
MSELLPDSAPLANGNWVPPGAIPASLREFGKYPNTSDWWPGDLLLTRDIEPDRVSRAITSAQVRGGYHQDDSDWTHAALYLGDGLNVCEASFDSPWRGGDVRITRLWDYCGSYALRVRRSTFITEEETGWLMAVSALTHLREDYDFSYVWKLALQAWSGRGFWQSDIRVSIKPSALVCSTLYADAHNRVTRRLLGESNGLCVPAYLSQCRELDEINADWLRIG